MLAVMKKDMSSSLQSNKALARSHACVQAAVKSKDRPTSVSAVAALASHVSALLLALPLPDKNDHGKSVLYGSVTKCVMLTCYVAQCHSIWLLLCHSHVKVTLSTTMLAM